MNPKDIRTSTDPDLAGSYAAMLRAARSAEEIAIKTNSSIKRPALKEAVSGLNGAKPAAIKSAFMNRSVFASAGKKSRANVVLPAPLGPAMMMIFFKFFLAIGAILCVTNPLINRGNRDKKLQEFLSHS